MTPAALRAAQVLAALSPGGRAAAVTALASQLGMPGGNAGVQGGSLAGSDTWCDACEVGWARHWQLGCWLCGGPPGGGIEVAHRALKVKR